MILELNYRLFWHSPPVLTLNPDGFREIPDPEKHPLNQQGTA